MSALQQAAKAQQQVRCFPRASRTAGRLQIPEFRRESLASNAAASVSRSRRRGVCVAAAGALDPLTVIHAVQHARDAGVAELQAHPSLVRGVASTATYCMGDLIAQKKPLDKIDARRLRNFTASGFGSGVLWGWWYDHLEEAMATHGFLPGVQSTLLSLTAEQFLWAPLFFGLYYLPLTGLLKGKNTAGVVQEVKDELGPTLWANAQVWTILNILIYNVPLSVRPFVSNLGDICWSAYLSFIVQSDAHPNAEEVEDPLPGAPVEGEAVTSQVVPFNGVALRVQKVLVGEPDR
mmetsp:Transcript_3936/g.10133  ORF Transcript_3936/g.10133 Transcript_3936/m.10133 type:complete len:292 (+) Transcript_3936:310-1185(+)